MKQTRTAQRRILDEAKRHGELHTLYWYMVAQLEGNRTEAVGVNGTVIVVPVAPDPAITEHDAHLMLELCKAKSPGLLLHLELTAVDILQESNMPWMVFGEIDLICPECAAVGWDSCVCQPTVWRVEDMAVAA